MNTFANRSLPVQLSLAKLFTFRWQFTVMRIIARRTLVEFYTKHPDSQTALEEWHKKFNSF